MLSCTYVGSYSGEKGHQFLQENWILALARSVTTFIMVSISDMPNIKYWQNVGKVFDTAKENIPKKCMIGDACFTSLSIIGGDLYTIHKKNQSCTQTC